VGEWWISGIGDNLLKGVNDDPLNPIRLPDTFIVDFLQRIPAARESFLRMIPLMLPDEQQRLLMLALYPFNNPTTETDRDASERFQHLLNTQGVRTTGPNSATRIGGNLPLNGRGR
jgi:hypothetical protein